jgi:hypothetical protein
MLTKNVDGIGAIVAHAQQGKGIRRRMTAPGPAPHQFSAIGVPPVHVGDRDGDTERRQSEELGDSR